MITLVLTEAEAKWLLRVVGKTPMGKHGTGYSILEKLEELGVYVPRKFTKVKA